MQAYKAVVFDFDGTLVDSAPGIMRALQLTMEAIGRPPLTQEVLRACFGPPILQFFPEQLGIYGEEMHEAIAIYRRIFDEVALPMLQVYPGIPALLQDLRSAGIQLGIATCKEKNTCIQQLEVLHIAQYIDGVGGAVAKEGLLEKADILRDVLQRMQVDPVDAIMVGDRMYDLIGANAVGVRAIGVLYGGCSTLEELEAHNPIAIVEDVASLRACLETLT